MKFYTAYIVQVIVATVLISSLRGNFHIAIADTGVYVNGEKVLVDSVKVEDVFIYMYSGDTIVKYQIYK